MTMASPVEAPFVKSPPFLPPVVKFDKQWQQIPRGWGHIYPTDFPYRLFRLGPAEQNKMCLLANFEIDKEHQHESFEIDKEHQHESFEIDKEHQHESDELSIDTVKNRHLLHILFAKLARICKAPVCDKSIVDYGKNPTFYGIATFLDLSHTELLTDASDAIPLENGVPPTIANKLASFFKVNKDPNLAYDFNRLCLFNLWLGLPLEPRTTILISKEQTYPTPKNMPLRMLRQRALHRDGMDAILASETSETEEVQEKVIMPFMSALMHTSCQANTAEFLRLIHRIDEDEILKTLTPLELSKQQRVLMTRQAERLITRRRRLDQAAVSLGLM